MKLRCSLLSLLRIHHPDCEHCNARGTSGEVMRKRLEELGWQAHYANNGDHEEVGSKPSEVKSAPISLKARKKKIA